MKSLKSILNGIFILLIVVMISCNSGQPVHTPVTHIIEIKDMQFQPAELTVTKGDTVMWINKDIVAHNATQKDSAWASPNLISDATWKMVINNSDSYYCSIHINMKGSLIVE